MEIINGACTSILHLSRGSQSPYSEKYKNYWCFCPEKIILPENFQFCKQIPDVRASIFSNVPWPSNTKPKCKKKSFRMHEFWLLRIQTPNSSQIDRFSIQVHSNKDIVFLSTKTISKIVFMNFPQNSEEHENRIIVNTKNCFYEKYSSTLHQSIARTLTPNLFFTLKNAAKN